MSLAELSRRDFLKLGLGSLAAIGLSPVPREPTPEKRYFYTNFRKDAPRDIYASVHSGEPLKTDTLPKDNFLVYTGKVEGDWKKWTNRPLKKKQGVGITTDEWLVLDLPNSQTGYVWSGFTYAIEYSKPMPDAKKYTVLACMGGIHTPMVYKEGEDRGNVVDTNTLKRLYDMKGYDIWLGYPDDGEPAEWDVQDGFAWPPDHKRAFVIKGIKPGTQDQPVEVWGYESVKDPTYTYIFPFTNTKTFARGDGKYWGIHPCGLNRKNALLSLSV